MTMGSTPCMKNYRISRLTLILIILLVVTLCVVLGLLGALVSRDHCLTTTAGTQVVSPHSEDSDVNFDKGNDDSVAGRNGTATTAPWINHRLPDHILPIIYDLILEPNLTTNIFEGQVNISVDVKSPTYYFILHAHLLNVTFWEVKYQNGTKVTVNKAFSYPKNEFFVIILQHQVNAGNYNLSFKFHGSLVNEIVGFYRSEYVNSNGERRALATTKFEPTYARRAYVCFDEPSFRANFTVTLIHTAEYFALSNMLPDINNNRSLWRNGLLATKFQTSVSMPTYLSCFIVCDFAYINTTTKDGKPFRVYAAPNQVAYAQNALEVGRQIKDFYETFFEIPYPLPKTDLIAIPDFISGAMENWGLITFRETSLLFNPQESSLANEKKVASVVAHELAHQWFGNLVTMNWWDDLWLNEGFANYMEYVGVTSVKKDQWHHEETIVVNDLQPVMVADSSVNSHPIIQRVNHPDEITEIFDSITYSKGCSVLRMLHHFLGDADFRRGLQNYLKKYSYSNAKTADLWTELTRASTKKLDVGSIMDTWTKQMGYPVIHIKKDSKDRTKFTARQERYLLSKQSLPKVNFSESSFGYFWEVPLTYRHPNGTVETEWLHKEIQKTFEIPWANDVVIKFNVDQTGFYKVNYEDDVWNSMSDILMHFPQNFSRVDRANLLNDAFTLSRSGYLKYSIALKLSKYLVVESDYLPWASVTSDLTSISALLMDTEIYPDFQKYIIQLCTPMYSRLGWADEGDHLTRLLRPIILNLMCFHNYAPCLQEAQEQLHMWMTGTAISTNLRLVIYRYGITNSTDSTEWTHMWNQYLKTSSAQEKINLLYGMAFTRQSHLLLRYLEYVKDKSTVRGQDFFTVLTYIAKNPVGKSIIWDFVREEWEYLVDRFTINDRYLGRMVKSITESFSRPIRLQEMKDFFSAYPDAGAGARSRSLALDAVQSNINWLKHYKDEIKSWLQHELGP